MAKELTEQNFQTEILDSPLPAIVDFWASWCMPCKMLAPTVDEIAREYENRIVVGKVNVDQEGQLAQRYSVLSIPTLLFFKNGELLETVVGVVPKEYIVEKIRTVFGEL